MNVSERGETVVSIKLKSEDREALEWAIEQVQQRAGPGVFISAGSAVRWALHTVRAGMSGTDDGEGLANVGSRMD